MTQCRQSPFVRRTASPQNRIRDDPPACVVTEADGATAKSVWKQKNKSGLECSVHIVKKGNKIILTTSNLGIDIENTTIIEKGAGEVYAAITGDQVAVTDIRIR